MFNLECKVRDGENYALYVADDKVRLFFVNDEGEFASVRDFSEKQFGEFLEELAGNKMKAKDLARITADTINYFAFNGEEFCEAMATEHRTLQQSFTRLCFEWIKTCAEMENFDARNEASVMACKKLQKVIEEEDIRLPLI